jgi:hypothetical protein
MKKEFTIEYIYGIGYLRGDQGYGGKVRGYGREMRRRKACQF